MKSYLIEDLQEADCAAIAARLNDMELSAGLEGLYWLPIPPEMYTPMQQEHAPECGPYAMALELRQCGELRLEFLVRARNTLRCDCIHYASTELQQYMISYVDALLQDLGIKI